MKILILEILNVFLRLKFSPPLTLNKLKSFELASCVYSIPTVNIHKRIKMSLYGFYVTIFTDFIENLFLKNA